MQDADLTAFARSADGTGKSGRGTLPESVPESLTEGWVPPVSNRSEIAPEHPSCDVQVGDLLAIDVGAEQLEVYGFLILDVYAGTLIGILLHNHTYAKRDLEDWVEWYEEYEENGAFESGEMRIYREIAPLNPPDTTNQ
jgi:hypothetical protein